MRKLLLFGICMALAWCANAQQRTIAGTVTDGGDGSVLPGVSVLIKGTTRGTATDSNGTYTIEVAPADVLAFSFIGFEPQELPVGQLSQMNVTMVQSISQLQEVVVIGYGEREKRDLTGAISSMDSKEISK
ncbi:MAG TPA: carboxypeptidase-like regulatory domain-containing protein, partial [Chryseolinea sp.]|nr:carboxypeptidase-like regulatory domain-containing protein [Chryseolinea sp.]